MISAPLKNALCTIASNGKETSTDDLVNIASVFLGVWRGCDSKNRICLKEIIRKIENFKYINLKIYPDGVVNDECKRVLDAFEDLEYHISGRMFYWRIGCMNGNCLWSDDLETEIKRLHPVDKWNIISMLL